MRSVICFFALALVALAPIRPAAAQPDRKGRPALVSYDKLLEYLDVGVKEEKLLKMIADSPAVLTLGKEQVEKLRKAGASDALIDAIQKKAEPKAAGDVGAFVVILDCSGSMKDDAEKGVSKWQAAQRAVMDFLGAIPNGREVGFVVYGHELERECNAVDVIRPLAPFDDAGRVALLKHIDALAPTGHTPIANALKLAGKELGRTTGMSRVILITDGIETCHGDPNKEAANLLTDHKNLRGVDVIGLGLTKEEADAVRQIAVSGKGNFYDAKSVKDLQDSVKTIQKAVAKAVPRPQGPVGKPMEKFVLKGHTNSVHAVAISADGKLIATAGIDKTIRLWDADTGERKERISHSHEIYVLAFSPDGKTLASGGTDKVVTLWDVASGDKLKAMAKGDQSVCLLRYSPDGKSLAVTAVREASVAIYDVGSGKLRHTLKGESGVVLAMAFAPDSKTVATASEDASIRLWDVTEGTEKDSFKAHDGAVTSVAFAPDGKSLVSGGGDKTVILWNIKTGNVRKPVLEGHTSGVVLVALLPDGQVLSRAQGGGMRLWRHPAKDAAALAKDVKTLLVFGTYYPTEMALTADGNTYVTASGNDVHVWDLSKCLGEKPK